MHEPLLDLAEYCAAGQAVIALHVCLLSPCVPGPQQYFALRCAGPVVLVLATLQLVLLNLLFQSATIPIGATV